MKVKGVVKVLANLTRSRPFKIEKPIVVQFPVNDICNSGCSMCHIWKNKKSTEISLEDLEKVASSDLFSNVETVGINGGEPTLRADLADLVSILYSSMPSLRNISMITNGYKSNQVIQRVYSVSEVVKANAGRLDLMVSLDGYGAIHDKVRGKQNYFDSSVKVLKEFRNNPAIDNLRVGCTITKANVYGLHELFDYCASEGYYIKYRIGIPHKRLYVSGFKEPFELNNSEILHVVEFMEGLISNYEVSPHQIETYQSIIGMLRDGSPRTVGCDWQHRGATITSYGEVLYCAVESDSVATVNDVELSRKYMAGKNLLSTIVNTKCASCIHDYTGVGSRAAILRRLINEIKLLKKIDSLIFRLITKRVRYFRRRNRLHKIEIVDSRQTKRAHPKFLICGWYGTETLGDKAILAGLAMCVESPEVSGQYDIASLHPELTQCTLTQFPLELNRANVISIELALKSISQYDAVIFGGGPIMAVDEIADIEAIFKAAKGLSIKCLVAGCGVGPFGKAYHNKAIAHILKLADVRIFRDVESLQKSNEILSKNETGLVASDPSITWLNKQVKKNLISKDKKTLLLGLRSFPHEQYAGWNSVKKNQAVTERFELNVVKFLNRISKEFEGLVIKPLPMCTNHYGGDDRWFYRNIFQKYGFSSNSLDYSLLSGEANADVYVDAFQTADVVLAMRFHSLVFARSLGVPVHCIDYTDGHGKNYNFCKLHGISNSSISELTSDDLYNNCKKLLHQTSQDVGKGVQDEFKVVMINALKGIVVNESSNA